MFLISGLICYSRNIVLSVSKDTSRLMTDTVSVVTTLWLTMLLPLMLIDMMLQRHLSGIQPHC